MINKYLLLYFFLLSMVSCTSNDAEIPLSDNLLIGSWVDPIYDGETITFKRASALPDNDYGISFKLNGILVERSSGWCGTPPLSFFDYTGTWEVEGSLILMSQEYLYPNNYAWRIVSLTETELVVKRELTNQENDYRDLMSLFDGLYELISSYSCNNASDWDFTAYGSKACGGPQGYIAYPKEIEAAFLEKVKAYTEAERAYNLKWEIISTCDVPREPIGVECLNGYPVLKY